MLIMLIAFLKKKWVEKQARLIWYHNSCHTRALIKPSVKSGHQVIGLVIVDLCSEVTPTLLVPMSS